MRLSCARIRVDEHTARPKMKAPGSEDDVRSKDSYDSFFCFLRNLNSLHTFFKKKKVSYEFLSHHPTIRDLALRIKKFAYKFSLFKKWNEVRKIELHVSRKDINFLISKGLRNNCKMEINGTKSKMIMHTKKNAW